MFLFVIICFFYSFMHDHKSLFVIKYIFGTNLVYGPTNQWWLNDRLSWPTRNEQNKIDQKIDKFHIYVVIANNKF